MSKHINKGILILAGVLLVLGMPEGRPAPCGFTVLQREGRTLVVEDEGGAQRVIQLKRGRVREPYRGLLGAAEGDVFCDGLADPERGREARLRVQRLQQRLLDRNRLAAQAREPLEDKGLEALALVRR